MTYVNRDNTFGVNLSHFCNKTGPDGTGLQNVSSLGELYINHLLADPSFDMVLMSLSIAREIWEQFCDDDFNL